MEQTQGVIEIARHQRAVTIAGAVLAALGAGGIGYYLLAPDSGLGAIGVIVGLPLLLLGLPLSLWRSGLSIDRQQRVVTDWRGILGLRKKTAYPLHAFDRVQLSHSTRDRASRYDAWLVRSNGDKIKLATSYEQMAGGAVEAPEVAEQVATLLRIKLYDDSSGFTQVSSPGTETPPRVGSTSPQPNQAEAVPAPAATAGGSPPVAPAAETQNAVEARLKQQPADSRISCTSSGEQLTLELPAMGLKLRIVIGGLVGLVLMAAGVLGLFSAFRLLSSASDAAGLSIVAELGDALELIGGSAITAAIGFGTALAALRGASLRTRLLLRQHSIELGLRAISLNKQVKVPFDLIEHIALANPLLHRPRSMLDYVAGGTCLLLLDGSNRREYLGHGLERNDLAWLASIIRASQ